MSEGSRLAEWSHAVRDSTLKRLRQVPAGCENHRVAPQAMSFADLAQHIVDADVWLFEKLRTRDLKPMVGQAGRVEISDRDQYLSILTELEATGTHRWTMLEQMTDAQLAEMIPDERFGREVTLWWIIVRGNLDHEIHHRGVVAATLAVLRSENSL